MSGLPRAPASTGSGSIALHELGTNAVKYGAFLSQASAGVEGGDALAHAVERGLQHDLGNRHAAIGQGQHAAAEQERQHCDDAADDDG